MPPAGSLALDTVCFELPISEIGAGETPAVAAASRLREDTGLNVEVSTRDCVRLTGVSHTDWYFRASLVFPSTAGTIGTSMRLAGKQLMFVDFPSLATGTLFPPSVAEMAMHALSTGEWWDDQTELSDPCEKPPSRVRAGALVINAKGQVLLIERNGPGRRWYEIPGGGIEPDELPEVAAVRELAEETGLAVVIRLGLATILKEGRREHYFLADFRDSAAEPRELDLRENSRLVWLDVSELPNLPLWPKRLAWRIAHWKKTEWPKIPVVLSDSIPDADLTKPCNW
ncbi:MULTISPECIES: NUDIX hydrolase [unclassified Streptomyces]|uniref:NUDIX hydrolase n=1 Tax=unclassified Streptomyces TaxID=2593676 RepID=UPI002E2EE108|nr:MULTISPECIES: NUDIX domain-containing protein [unclassified Streptomyces]